MSTQETKPTMHRGTVKMVRPAALLPPPHDASLFPCSVKAPVDIYLRLLPAARQSRVIIQSLIKWSVRGRNAQTP